MPVDVSALLDEGVTEPPSRYNQAAGKLFENHEISVSADTRPPNLTDCDRPELEAALAARGHERFRARQIFRWLYRRGVVDAERMTDLPHALRTTIATEFTMTTPTLVARETS